MRGKSFFNYLWQTELVWIGGGFGFVLVSLPLGSSRPWLGLVAAGVPLLVRWWRWGWRSLATPFDLPIALFVAGAGVGLVASSQKLLAWGAFQTLLACLFLYYALASARPRWGAVWLSMGSFLLGGFLALSSVSPAPQAKRHLQALSALIQSPDLESRLRGAFSVGTGLSVVLVALLTLFTALVLFHSQTKVRLAAGFAGLGILLLLVFSPSHGVWAVAGVGLLFLLAWRNRWWLLTLPGWLGLFLWSVSLRTNEFPGVALRSFNARLGFWEDTLRLLGENPLFGLGPGHFSLVFPSYSGYQWVHTPHNAYLQIYSDTGLLGGLALLGAALVYLRLLWGITKASPTHPAYALALGIAAAVLAVAFYGLWESSPAGYPAMASGTIYYSFSPLFWVLGGGLVWAYRRLQAPV